MSIEWRCECGQKLQAPDDAVGTLVRCASCSRASIVPEPRPAEIATAETVDLHLPTTPLQKASASSLLGPKTNRAPTASTMQPVSAAALAHADAHARHLRMYLLLAIVLALVAILGAVALGWWHNRSHAQPSEPPPGAHQQPAG